MEMIVDDRVQTLIDAAFTIEEVVEKVLGGLSINEIFANRRVAKAWRKAAFRALRSKGFVYYLHDVPEKEELEIFKEKFSVDCYIPVESAVGVSDDDDSLLTLSKDYSKFVVGLFVREIPAGFQFQWSDLWEFPRLEWLNVYYSDNLHKTDPTAKFLSKIVHNSKYLKDFFASISISIGSEYKEGDLPQELTYLHVYTEPTFPEPASFPLPTHLPNLKVLSVYIVDEDESELWLGTDLKNVQRVKAILEKFSPQMEEFRLDVTGGYLLPYLRLLQMDKLQRLCLPGVSIECADASKPLPELLPKLKTLELGGERETVFGNMAAFFPGEDHGLEELTLSFPIEGQWEKDVEVEDGGDWELFPPLIRNLKVEMDLAVWFVAFLALPSLNKLQFQGYIEVDPALIEAWTSAGRQIEIEP